MPITIDKPSKYFDTKLYTGTGSTLSISGINFSPDLVWVKRRDTTGGNKWTDTVRGAGIVLVSNATDAEFSQTGISSFNSDGFTVGTDSGDFNANGGTYASWNWRGSDSSAVTNNSGSITSTVSANTTSGFSIVSYTGTGSVGTVGHGLGVAPKMLIVKNRDQGTGGWNWKVYHASLGNTQHLSLNRTDATQTSTDFWNNTSPTSTVFTLGTDGVVNVSSNNFIAYCFAEVKGFSKAFSYTGNGSSDGTFVYTGMRPAFIIVKRTDTTGTWFVFDNKRDTYNFLQRRISPNESSAEGVSGEQDFDFLSNGFKPRRNAGDWNASGGTYIGFAVAESPFVSSKGVPVCAR